MKLTLKKALWFVPTDAKPFDVDADYIVFFELDGKYRLAYKCTVTTLNDKRYYHDEEMWNFVDRKGGNDIFSWYKAQGFTEAGEALRIVHDVLAEAEKHLVSDDLYIENYAHFNLD